MKYLAIFALVAITGCDANIGSTKTGSAVQLPAGYVAVNNNQTAFVTDEGVSCPEVPPVATACSTTSQLNCLCRLP